MTDIRQTEWVEKKGKRQNEWQKSLRKYYATQDDNEMKKKIQEKTAI